VNRGCRRVEAFEATQPGMHVAWSGHRTRATPRLEVAVFLSLDGAHHLADIIEDQGLPACMVVVVVGRHALQGTQHLRPAVPAAPRGAHARGLRQGGVVAGLVAGARRALSGGVRLGSRERRALLLLMNRVRIKRPRFPVARPMTTKLPRALYLTRPDEPAGVLPLSKSPKQTEKDLAAAVARLGRHRVQNYGQAYLLSAHTLFETAR